MTVVITGASFGIGNALAKEYAKNGYSLILIARNIDKLNELKNAIQKDYMVDINIYPYDLTNNSKEFYEKILKTHKDIEILINNAAVGIAGEFISHSLEEEHSLIDLNIKAIETSCMLFLSYFKEKNSGKIINISSVGAMIPGMYMASYYASKVFISSFSYSLSKELKKTNIDVLSIQLPRIETDFDLHAKRKGKLKKGKNPSWVAKKIVKAKKRRGILNIGLSTKVTNLLTHILPRGLIAFAISDKLK